jgi:hypothetical protein
MPRNTKQVLYEALTTIPIDQSIVSGLGTVTSVSMTTPSILNVSGSPITTSGSLGLTLTTQTANTVFAGATSGGAATPTFRALVAADIPSLSGTYQPLDATLTALAGLTIAANSLTVGTGADAFSQTTFAANTFPARASTGSLTAKTITDFGLSLVDDADASAGRTTLGLGTMATQNATAVAVTGGSGVFTSLAIKDFGGGPEYLSFASNEVLSANRSILISTADGDRNFNLEGDLTVTGTTSVEGIFGASVYTPTRSAEANLTGTVTMSQAQYMQVGTNTVAVSGQFTADPVLAATATSFEFTLPIASNIGAVEDAAGTAFCGAVAGMGASISGSVANNTAVVSWISSDITSQTWSYCFMYQVI